MSNLLTWVPVRSGHLAISSRPKARAFQTIAAEGTTHVLTLLAEKEEAPSIGELVETAGMDRIWFPLENGNPIPKIRDAEVSSLLSDVKRLLDQGARILIHCSAGIHRTGMITNAILRWTGHDSFAAHEKLAQLRSITSEGVGDRRLAYANELILRVRGKSRSRDDDEHCAAHESGDFGRMESGRSAPDR